MELISTVTGALNLMTLGTDILITAWFVLIVCSLFLAQAKHLRRAITRAIGPNARLIAFIVALTAMSGSLFYSEVAHYTPCLLCWYQRIAMYPQVLILGLSIVTNDRRGVVYAAALSVVGVILAEYHYYIQTGGPTILPCSAVGYSESCSQRFTTTYGYITIPMMALSAFVAILILSGIFLQYGKKK